MGSFLKGITLSALRHKQEVWNSELKRGVVKNPQDILSTRLVFCGCGDPTCVFMSVQRKKDGEEQTGRPPA